MINDDGEERTPHEEEDEMTFVDAMEVQLIDIDNNC